MKNTIESVEDIRRLATRTFEQHPDSTIIMKFLDGKRVLEVYELSTDSMTKSNNLRSHVKESLYHEFGAGRTITYAVRT